MKKRIVLLGVLAILLLQADAVQAQRIKKPAKVDTSVKYRFAGKQKVVVKTTTVQPHKDTATPKRPPIQPTPTPPPLPPPNP